MRQMLPADAPEILVLRSDDRTMNFIGREKTTSLADAEKFIATLEQSFQNNEGIYWGICRPDNFALIGNIGFWRIDKAHHRAEIGYMLHPDFWGQGIMNEALAKVLDYGFRKYNFHSVEANVNPDNTASVKLLEKFNFVREGYYREHYFVRGVFQDTASYSLLAPAK